MKTENWPQIKQLYLAALERDKDERATFLATACAGDENLLREVESLLANQTEAESFLEQPALDVATQVLADEETQAKFTERIGAYRILQRLGAGGMGEVYLAEDGRLGRKVALKLLPAAFTSDREAVWRFTQEARAASALNHPNIITIFEIGQTESTHFIATEFIDGQTLRQRLKEGNIALLEALDILVQTGSALVAAHEAGIFHRDIKPENLMLRRDGYVKVLDFGLAKLTETQRSEFATQMAGDVTLRTRSGVVMGTLAYMSPEQARGQKVDARTDIFSLGVVSYELLAGQRPFIGTTGAEVVAAVLHTEPPALTQVAPELPAALAAIISKMLRKERAQRYQTINEVLAELKALKRQLEFQAELARSGEEAATKAQPRTETLMETAGGLAKDTQADHSVHTTSASEVLLSELKRHKMGVALTMLALLIALGGFGFWLYKLVRERQAPTPFQTMALTRITASGNVREAAISPDGKYLVHIADENGKQSLWLKQTAAASSVQIAPPTEGVNYSNPTFSRAGDFIYFLREDGGSPRAALYQIPVLGGEARKLIADISTQDTRSNIAFSPDGKELAFVRLDATFNRALLIAKVDGSNERMLATRLKPVFLAGLAWSPDGQTIACVEGTFGQTMKLMAIRVADGMARPISTQDWANIVGLAWLADGSGLAISAADKPGAAQLWHISYPGGEARRITNDLNSYIGVSLAADASALATVQRDEAEYLWIAPDGDASRARKIIAEAGDYDQLQWTPDGRLLYASVTSNTPGIWIINADGTAKKRLTATANNGSTPSVSPDGRHIYFGGGPGHGLWRMESDGSNPQQLLGGAVSSPLCSPDSKWVVYYAVRGDDGPYLWRVLTEGGEPQRLTHKNSATRPVISPDGRWIACNYLIWEPNAQFRIAIFPFEGGEPSKTFDVFGSAMRELRWTPDGRAIAYLETRNGVSNIVAQPVDGGAPKQLTNFQSDHVLSWNWSHDGKQLAIARAPQTSDVVLINSFR